MSDSTSNIGPSTPVDPTPSNSPTGKPRSGSAIAALVLGIVAFVMAVVPGPSFAAFAPAIVAGILGILALRRQSPRRGQAIAGVILGPVALLIAIIVSSVTIVGAGSTPSHVAADSSSNSSKAAPKPAPSPSKTATPIPASIAYTGTGDSILKIALPDGAGQFGLATIVYTGSENFAVWSLDSNLAQQDLMVNTIGSYSGTVLFNAQLGHDASSIQVSASGPWTITLKSIRAADQITGTTASGSGDDVLIYRGAADPATITSTGSDNFAVWEYGAEDNLLVNEIGAYSGTVPFAAGPSLIAISATGAWNIALN
jgi:hypothetical protein